MKRVVIVRLVLHQPGINARDQIPIEGRWLVSHVRHAVEILARRLRIEGRAIVEYDTLLQMKYPLRLLRIRLPRLGKHRHDFPIIRNPDQRLPSLQDHGGVVGILLPRREVPPRREHDLFLFSCRTRVITASRRKGQSEKEQ